MGARRLDRQSFPLSGCCVVGIFYRWRNQQTWTFFLFVFVLISPTILYLASMLLFPREGGVDESIDYKTHYYANHRAFFALFSLFTPVDIVDSLLKGTRHFLELGPQYTLSGILYFAGLVTAALRVIAKKFLQLIVRRSIHETMEASVFGELLGRAHKPTPRHTRERTAHTHSPHAERSSIRHR